MARFASYLLSPETRTRNNKSIYRAFPEAGRSQSASLRRQAIPDHRHRFVDWRGRRATRQSVPEWKASGHWRNAGDQVALLELTTDASTLFIPRSDSPIRSSRSYESGKRKDETIVFY